MNRMIFLIGLLMSTLVIAQSFEANYDESKIPDYTLPDPLTMTDGSKVNDAETWIEKRRPEIFSLFEELVYGRAPGKIGDVTYELLESSDDALNGIAVRKQVRVYLLGDKNGPYMDVLIYLPPNVKPAPLFVGLNFYGNQTIVDDPAVRLNKSWARNNEDFGIEKNHATEASRGVRSSRWPVEFIIQNGYGLAAIYYGDIDPDDEGRFDNGIHPHFYNEGQKYPDANEWGSIAAWAWGLSRAMDYFEQDADINKDKVAVMVHSRLGKTSLWAGAADERFALVISNDSGCGGAALSRRRIGETVGRINRVFPHWFCDNFNQYNENEDAIPVDQHELIALMAPRPVYVASAELDRWADPRGEFLSAKLASPVYELFGLDGLPADEMPEVNHPVAGSIGYHVRTGGHAVMLFDWQQYIKFADKHLKCVD